jgi:hypothetical protein
MLFCGSGHFGRASHGLDGQIKGERTREAGSEPAIGERLHYEIDESRAASAQAGYRVERVFGY